MVNVSLHVLHTPVFPSAERNKKHAQEKNSCVPAQLLCCTEADGCPREMLLEEVHPAKYLLNYISKMLTRLQMLPLMAEAGMEQRFLELEERFLLMGRCVRHGKI